MQRSMTWIRWTSLALVVWGIPGMIDDGAKWAEWLIDIPPFVSVIAFVLLIGGWGELVIRRRTMPPSVAHPDRTSESSSESKLLLGQKRGWCPRSPEDLIELTKGRTDIAKDHVLQPYKGTWLEFEGTLEEAEERGPDGYTIHLEMGKGLSAWFWMQKKTDKAMLIALRKGDQLKVQGTLRSVSPLGLFHLDDGIIVG